MKPIHWRGIYPAVTTKFTSEGDLDIKTFQSGIAAQIKSGANGIIIGGSVGESSTISHDERIQLLHAGQEIANDVPVLLNVAEGSTRNAILLAQRAEKEGADGLMVLPPMMYKPTDEEVVTFFETVSVNTSLPILIYNNPVDYKIEVTPTMFDQLLKHNNIQAVKESTRDLANISRLISLFGERLKILSGVDTIALESLITGAHGWVAGLVNAFPDETVAIYRLIKAGRIEEAIRIHRWFLPLLELDIHQQLVQNIKLAEMMTGLGTEYVRPPRQMLSGQVRKNVIRIIEQGIATRPSLPSIN
ncbi:MAG: dihydrodipicolinate synthase family protein [Bacteroidota bacterium]|nr:dihydrodipicolinate synthase family protein [Bacteroidota bacterium]